MLEPSFLIEHFAVAVIRNGNVVFNEMIQFEMTPMEIQTIATECGLIVDENRFRVMTNEERLEAYDLQEAQGMFE